jgi:DNA polymerase sigma
MFNSWRKANSSKFENSLLNKIVTDESIQCTFYHKLHNDIIDYSFKVKEILDYLKPAKDFVIELIKLTINQTVDQILDNEIYGSYATELSIESSDVDILIKIDQDFVDLDNLINKICISFASLKVIDSINPIATASIPVIKLVS